MRSTIFYCEFDNNASYIKDQIFIRLTNFLRSNSLSKFTQARSISLSFFLSLQRQKISFLLSFCTHVKGSICFILLDCFCLFDQPLELSSYYELLTHTSADARYDSREETEQPVTIISPIRYIPSKSPPTSPIQSRRLYVLRLCTTRSKSLDILIYCIR